MQLEPRVVEPYSLSAATKTGAGNVWADDSDSTYITITDSSPPIANYARGTLQTPAQIGHTGGVSREAKVWARFKATGPAPHARLFFAGLGSSYDALPAVADPAPGWFRAPLSDVDAVEFIDDWAGGYACTAQLSSQFNGGAAAIAYEAGVLIEWHADAPPCRLFPRADGLGVGGGRRYPPAKTQQRSARRFGYY